ncbi:hypothetical protein FAIPA1_50201 [Frankia sp. AiPs1]
MPPAMGQYQHPHTKAWAEAVAAFDAYVFVTARGMGAAVARSPSRARLLWGSRNPIWGHRRIRESSSGWVTRSGSPPSGGSRTAPASPPHPDAAAAARRNSAGHIEAAAGRYQTCLNGIARLPSAAVDPPQGP